MKKLLLIIFMALTVKWVSGITIYVSPPGGYGTNHPPYTNWAYAATNIIEAVNSAGGGDTVLVTNGLPYVLTNRIEVRQNITVQSVNGYSNTIINGNFPYTTNPCFYVTNTGSIVDGFTISNGVANLQGGGIYLLRGVLRNCLIVNNQTTNADAGSSGGGIYVELSGIISNCIVMRNGNSGTRYGAGIYYQSSSKIYNSQISENGPAVAGAGGVQGGSSESLIYNSTIFNNYGTGFECKGGTALYCRVIGNSGVGMRFYASTMPFVKNCLIASNGTDGISIYDRANVENCTVARNYRGLYSTSAAFVAATFINTIISDSTSGTNWIADQSKTSFTNSCTTPLVTNGTGNIDVDPQFQDAIGGNFRLKGNSPCINAGFNQSWMTNSYDLDGRTRIRYGTVDMGAYERIHEGTIYKLW